MEEKSRKILILTTAYLPQIGGSELAIKNITERLPEFEFDLITSRFSPDVPSYEKIGNVNVYRVGNFLNRFSFLLPKNFLPIAIFFKARQLIDQYGQYDLIHAFQASQAAGGGWLLKWIYPKIPFLITVQEGKVLTSQSWLIRFFRYLIFKKSNQATAISNYLANYIVSQNKNLPVAMIPNGVDITNYELRITNYELRQKLGIKSDDKVIITVSRLVSKNGIGDLIDAFAHVRQRYAGSIKLLIIGGGELKENLKSQIKELKLEGDVLMVGEIKPESVPDYLYLADVFVRPSLSEGLGNAFLEAMAAGVPIVATPVGGIVDFLEDGRTGLFCKAGDAEDIGEKIITLLSDDELRQKIIINSKELIQQKYTWPAIADTFRNLYETIAKN